MFKPKFFNKLITVVSILALFSAANAYALDYRERPHAVQDKVDEVFDKVATYPGSDWTLHNGEFKYYICGLDDEKLIRDIITHAPAEQNEFYFVDVGAGQFQWVNNVVRFLKNDPVVPKNKRYHIIGLNGEGRGDEIIHDNNFIVYKLGNFKTENMIEAFEKKGMHLNGKIDLMVSQWTLRHLVDPLGTFLQMHELTKLNGYILLDGIPFLTINTNGNDIYTATIADLNLNAERLLLT